jgi:hypothetical protein
MRSSVLRILSLPLLLWLNGLAFVAWSWWKVVQRDLHPTAWPFAIMLMVLIGGPLILAIRACGSLIFRGTWRLRWGTFLTGSVPLSLIAAQVILVYMNSLKRYIDLSPTTLVILPVASVAADLEANVRYPVHTTGERVVMHHDGMPDAEEIVREADQHVAKLERLLGQPGRAKIHWVLGSCLGRRNCSFGAFAICEPHTTKGLSQLDRHELAHATINQFLESTSRPSMLLTEGWAEAQAASDVADVHETARRERGVAPTIAKLTGPSWARIDVGPVYMQGGSFVAYLLEEFGGPKFLELYATSRPESFDADCRRVLESGIDEIEARYLQAQPKPAPGARLTKLLSSLKTAPEVDQAAWIQFAGELAREIDQLQLSGDYEIRVESTTRVRQPDGSEQNPSTNRFRIAKAGSRKLFVADNIVMVGNGESSFELRRGQATQRWNNVSSDSIAPVLTQYSIASQLTAVSYVSPFEEFFDWRTTATWRDDPPVIIRFEQRLENETRITEFDLDWSTSAAATAPHTWHVQWHESADARAMELRSEWHGETRTTNLNRMRCRLVDGEISHVRGTHMFESRAGNSTHTTEIEERVVRPPEFSESEFLPETYGIPRATIGAESRPWVFYAVLGTIAVQCILGVVLLLSTLSAPPS